MRPRPSTQADRLVLPLLLTGALAVVPLPVAGDLYAGELLLVVLGLAAMAATRQTARVMAFPHVGLLAGAMLLSLAGYMLSDLVRGSSPDQYLRGWARVVLLLLEFVALARLCLPRPARFLWFVAGYGSGGIAWLVLVHQLDLSHWKLLLVDGKFVPGYGEYTVALFAVLAAMLSPLVTAAGFALLALYSLASDFRSLAALCGLSALLIGWRGRAVRRGSLIPLLAGLVALAALLGLGLSMTGSDSTIERRQQSNAGRLFGLESGLRIVAHSPFVGQGSWGRSAELAAIQRDILHDHAGMGELLAGSEAGLAVSVHSAILQTWVEGGIAGAAALLVLAALLLAHLRQAVAVRPPDALTALIVWYWLLGLWNLVNSGFLGRTRLSFALLAALVVLVAASERTGVRTAVRAAAGVSGLRTVRIRPGRVAR